MELTTIHQKSPLTFYTFRCLKFDCGKAKTAGLCHPIQIRVLSQSQQSLIPATQHTKYTLSYHLQPVIMSQQARPSFQECSEIHTIQVFRDADTIMEQQQQQQRPAVISEAVPSTVPSTSVPYLDAELYENKPHGIGEDWAIDEEMNEDSIIESPPANAERRGSDSTLYSFYFETPLVTMANTSHPQPELDMDAASNDDFTICSQDSESFHITTDLKLESLEDSASFWETGLSAAASTTTAAPLAISNHSVTQQHRCASPAHVSLQGEEQQPQQLRTFSSR